MMGNRKMTFIIALLLMFCMFMTTGDKHASAKKTYKEGFSYMKITKQIKRRINGKSYRTNKHIKYSDLRYVNVKYYNYNGKVRNGELIVNKAIAKDIVEIFYELYKIKYPIRRMRLVDEYKADDDISMAADNTSCFNYRSVSGSSNLSLHALGLAIDINPRVNPCVGGLRGVVPENGKVYKERDVKKCRGKYKDNMIHKNDEIYKIFKKHGFSWGGDWNNMKDYQHFYKMVDGYSNNLKYEW